MRGGDPADNGQGLPNAGLPAFCSLLGWGRKQKGRGWGRPVQGTNKRTCGVELARHAANRFFSLFVSFIFLLLFCLHRRKSDRQLGSEFIQITLRGRTDVNRWCILKV